MFRSSKRVKQCKFTDICYLSTCVTLAKNIKTYSAKVNINVINTTTAILQGDFISV